MARRKNKLGPTNVNIKHVSEETAKKQKLKVVNKAGLDEALSQNRSLNQEINKSVLENIASATASAYKGKNEEGNAVFEKVPLNDYAAERQLKQTKRWDFSFPGRSRAKFLEGKSLEEIKAAEPKPMPRKPSTKRPAGAEGKIKSGDIWLTPEERQLEKDTAERLKNIHKEYLGVHNIGVSTPSKPKKKTPSLAERTQVGPKSKE